MPSERLAIDAVRSKLTVSGRYSFNVTDFNRAVAEDRARVSSLAYEVTLCHERARKLTADADYLRKELSAVKDYCAKLKDENRRLNTYAVTEEHKRYGYMTENARLRGTIEQFQSALRRLFEEGNPNVASKSTDTQAVQGVGQSAIGTLSPSSGSYAGGCAAKRTGY